MKSNQTLDSGSKTSLMLEEIRKRNKLGFQTPTQLSDDLINEIVNHLPVKSNFRFKCVSKQWYSLNSEALKLKSRAPTMSGMFYVTGKAKRNGLSVEYARAEKGDGNEDSCIDETLSFLPEHRYMRIHDSCNGLLIYKGWDDSLSDTSCLYVCNPATRKWVKIPCNHVKAYSLMTLDFNPRVSVHFSVVAIRSYGYQFSALEVFSSKSGEWRVSPLTNKILCKYGFQYYSTLIFNGLIFCINCQNSNVAGFDMEGNCCRRIDLPGEYHEKNARFGLLWGSLFQSGGCLNYYYISEWTIYVWKLMDYETGSWLLRNSFLIIGPMTGIQDFRFHSNKDEVVFIKIKDKLHSYNIQTAEVIELCSFHAPAGYFPYSPCYLDGFGHVVESK